MQVLVDAILLLAGYVIGSIPFGLIIVKLMTGKDIRSVASGRTGGTNAMRAAGPWAGVLTAVLDILKAAATVWLAKGLTPNVWVHTLAPIAAVIGHNYSLFYRSWSKWAHQAPWRCGWGSSRRRSFWPLAASGFHPDPSRCADLVF